MVFLKKIYLFIFLIIIACAQQNQSIKTAAIAAMPSKANHNMQQILSWDIFGVIAIRDHNKSWNATFNWLQSDDNIYQIRLFAPLGSGTMLISNQHGMITYNDGKHISISHNANLLLQQKTGIILPVHNLYYWIRGLPAPQKIQQINYDQYHNLKLLKQSGYVIEYLDYIQYDKLTLPRVLKIYGSNIIIKIIIKQWQFKH